MIFRTLIAVLALIHLSSCQKSHSSFPWKLAEPALKHELSAEGLDIAEMSSRPFTANSRSALGSDSQEVKYLLISRSGERVLLLSFIDGGVLSKVEIRFDSKGTLIASKLEKRLQGILRPHRTPIASIWVPDIEKQDNGRAL